MPLMQQEPPSVPEKPASGPKTAETKRAGGFNRPLGKINADVSIKERQRELLSRQMSFSPDESFAG